MPPAQKFLEPSVSSSRFSPEQRKAQAILNTMISKYDLHLNQNLINKVVDRAATMEQSNEQKNPQESKRNVRRALFLELGRSNPELFQQVKSKISGEGTDLVAQSEGHKLSESSTTLVQQSPTPSGAARAMGTGHKEPPTTTQLQRQKEFAAQFFEHPGKKTKKQP